MRADYLDTNVKKEATRKGGLFFYYFSWRFLAFYYLVAQ